MKAIFQGYDMSAIQQQPWQNLSAFEDKSIAPALQVGFPRDRTPSGVSQDSLSTSDLSMLLWNFLATNSLPSQQVFMNPIYNNTNNNNHNSSVDLSSSSFVCKSSTSIMDSTGFSSVCIPKPIRPSISNDESYVPPQELLSLPQSIGQSSNAAQSPQKRAKELYSPQTMFGITLSSSQSAERRAIRAMKIEKYLEKKENRQWNVLRYQVRKTIAKTRLRIKGRFVRDESKNQI